MDLGSAVFVPDDRYEYGEDRVRAFGVIGGRLHVLVFTPRGETMRVMSLRKANGREMRHYARQA